MSMPAAHYIRMSTDKEEQEASPARQRSTVKPLCEREGYHVVEEYFDDGISGTTATERPQFQRMMADAVTGKFKVIVADSNSRISRMDEWDFFETIAPQLRKAGVIINTVADGLLDWDDPFAFLKAALKTRQDNEFAKAVSHNVTSGSIAKAKDGRNMGAIPYGYESIKDNPKEEKGRRHLEISDDTREKAEIVRWIFQAYDAKERPLRGICKTLNDKGIPSPDGKRWQPVTIRRILTNERYTGTQFYGKTACGKFNRIINGKQEKCKQGLKPQKNSTYTKVPNAHEAIVSQEVFDRIQAKIAENQDASNRRRKRAGSGGHVFSGMVVCGGCGKNMVPKLRRGRVYWACDNRTGTCATPSFAEDRINLRINEMLQTGVFKDEIYSRHVALLTEKVNQAKLQIDPKRIEKLQAEIKAAKKNHLFLPDDWKPDAMEGIREREAELKKLESQLQSVVDVEDLFKRTRDALEEGIRRFRIMGREPELRDIEQTAGKARHRAALRSWLKKITIFWKRVPPRKYELLAVECETQWEGVQRWPPEIAILYRQVLAKARQACNRRMPSPDF